MACLLCAELETLHDRQLDERLREIVNALTRAGKRYGPFKKLPAFLKRAILSSALHAGASSAPCVHGD